MSFPGVLAGDAGRAGEARRPSPAAAVDGHAPVVPAPTLAAYAAAGAAHDHECTDRRARHARNSRAGLVVFFREATNAQQPARPPACRRRPRTPAASALCTDDRQSRPSCSTTGSIDALVRMAIGGGARSAARADAWRRSTRPSASGCADRGAVAPGRRADLIALPATSPTCGRSLVLARRTGSWRATARALGGDEPRRPAGCRRRWTSPGATASSLARDGDRVACDRADRGPAGHAPREVAR